MARRLSVALALLLAVAACGEQNEAIFSDPTSAEPTPTEEAGVAGEEEAAATTTVEVAPTDPPTVDDDAELEATFEGYRQALVARDGEAAVSYVSDGTIAWYDEVLVVALHAEAEALEGDLALPEALTAVPLRARFGDQLTTMTGRELFVRAVEEGLVGDDVETTQLDEIRLDPDGGAYGYVQGQPLFRFDRSADGPWSLDLEATVERVFGLGPEAELVRALSGGQASTRVELLELLATLYGTTWPELGQPIAPAP